jgi:hypothetical protein
LWGAGVPIGRTGLQPTRELEAHCLAGPYHPSLGQLVQSAIAFDMAERLLNLGGRCAPVSFSCHPKEVSNLRGQRNENILRLRDRFGLREISVEASDRVPRECLVLQTSGGRFSMYRGELPFGEQTDVCPM